MAASFVSLALLLPWMPLVAVLSRWLVYHYKPIKRWIEQREQDDRY